MVFGLLFSHLDAARNQREEQLPMRGHYTITHPASEISTSRACADTEQTGKHISALFILFCKNYNDEKLLCLSR